MNRELLYSACHTDDNWLQLHTEFLSMAGIIAPNLPKPFILPLFAIKRIDVYDTDDGAELIGYDVEGNKVASVQLTCEDEE